MKRGPPEPAEPPEPAGPAEPSGPAEPRRFWAVGGTEREEVLPNHFLIAGRKEVEEVEEER